jgi:A/G-specific adenine glycosylase
MPPPSDVLHRPVLAWYERRARDLPWRGSDVTPWGVLVSEVMLQQTPVSRVLPVWEAWLERWPSPSSLAESSPGDAVRMWDRLGYPRRALRLHAAATAIVQQHDGRVPDHPDDLAALPGIGSYTAAAVATFAFGQRHAVVDTNVRRVHARAVTGVEHPAPALTTAERRLAEELLPEDAATSARWAVAVMELGALVCTARSPRCVECPLVHRCAWQLAGRPAHQGAPRRGQSWSGTDRQVRGRLMAVLRGSDRPVGREALEQCWHEAAQRERCLDSLVADGLVEPLAERLYRLPERVPQ